MITELQMEHFKCFDSLQLPLSPLTLFTGFNAAGKSTVLQTLLLLAQTLRTQRRSPELRLQGPMANLGVPRDVINRSYGGNELSLGVRTNETALLWKFVKDESERTFGATKLEFTSADSNCIWDKDFYGIRPNVCDEPVSKLLESIEHVIFLSGSRQVDTDLFPTPEDPEDSIGDVGPLGQYAAWWLHQEGDNPLQITRRHRNAQSLTTIRQQLNAWADDLFPGTEFNSIPIPGTSQMRLQIKSSPTSDWTRPANIGYGITYAFPTLLAGLTVPEGRTLIIDSPESHLHPRGQARIGSFLAQMAASGVQILLETHSDHVMDGVRIAIREGLLQPEKAAFHYFDRNDSTTRVTSPQIDSDGRLSEWPEGFFDQHRRNMARLVSPKASR